MEAYGIYTTKLFPLAIASFLYVRGRLTYYEQRTVPKCLACSILLNISSDVVMAYFLFLKKKSIQFMSFCLSFIFYIFFYFVDLIVKILTSSTPNNINGSNYAAILATVMYLLLLFSDVFM